MPANKLDLLLQQGVNQLNLTISAQQQKQLIDFLHCLNKWNKAYNLTAITDLSKMVSHHLLDSLAVMPHLHAQTLLDIGSGAGFPGIPLAICMPQQQFTLLDSNGKKTRFLQQVVIELQLANVQIEQQRIEKFRPKSCFDAIIMRAVSRLEMMWPLVKHLLCREGEFLAMKGVYPEEELRQLVSQEALIKYRVASLLVPGLEEAERHLVVIEGE